MELHGSTKPCCTRGAWHCHGSVQIAAITKRPSPSTSTMWRPLLLLLLATAHARAPPRAGGRLSTGIQGRLQGAGVHSPNTRPRRMEDLSWWQDGSPRTEAARPLASGHTTRHPRPSNANEDDVDLLLGMSLATCLAGLSVYCTGDHRMPKLVVYANGTPNAVLV